MIKKLTLFIFLVSVSIPSWSQLFINEVLAANASVNYDPDFFNYGSWIEIYNSGGTAVNLTGFSISDNKAKPDKWAISSATISAGGFLIIWADKMNTKLHTDFSLSANGEFIGLYDASKAPVDSFTFSAQRPNVSYGRKTDGAATLEYFGKPTPGKTNNTASAVVTAANPIFSVKGGFYSSAKLLTLSNISVTAKIYYTLDGSEPGDTSALFSTPINISKNTIIRARAYDIGFMPSDIITQTYFWNELTTIPFVSITIPPRFLYDDSIGIYVQGKNGIMNGTAGPANFYQSWERAGNVEFFKPNDSAAFNTYCGIEISGSASRGFPQKSLDIKIKDTYGKDKVKYNLFPNRGYNNIHSFVLRNSGNDWKDGGNNDGYGLMCRDGLINTFTQGQMDVDYMSYRAAHVFINGKYWGLTDLREKEDKYYCNNNFPNIDKDSVDIMKQSTMVPYELQSGDTILMQKFFKFIRTNDMSSSSNYKKVQDSMDIREFNNYLIVETYSNNIDWPVNNIKLWRQQGVSKWRWMLFDLDMGFNGMGVSWNSISNTNKIADAFKTELDHSWTSLVQNSLMKNTSYKNDYAQTYAAHINTTYQPKRINAIIDSVSKIVRPEVSRHITRWGGEGSIKSLANWDTHIQYTRNFANQRPSIVWTKLKDALVMYDMAIVRVKRTFANMGMVYIQGATMYDSVMTGPYFNTIPIELKAEPKQGYYFIKWEIKKTGAIRYSKNAFLIDTLKSTSYKDTTFYTAIFSASPNDAFILTVNGGTGSGPYAPGTIVKINAKTSPVGKMFDKWTGGVAGIASLTDSSTTLIMPSANVSINATFRIYSGLSTMQDDEVEIYPNPASDHVEIILNESIQGTISILNLSGETMLTQEIHSAYANLGTAHLAPGVYVISIRTQQGITIRKMIKQ